jgi:hypothetical protein
VYPCEAFERLRVFAPGGRLLAFEYMMTWLQILILIGWSAYIAAVGTAIIKLAVHAMT